MKNEISIKINDYWTIKTFGPRYYTATRNDGEHRIYWSKGALERDFGTVIFPQQESSAIQKCMAIVGGK